VGVLGLSYKPNTDDVRDSPSIDIIRKLQDRGARIRCYDPQAMENARRELKDVTFCSDPYDTAKECQGLVLCTEWNEFRKLDLDRLRQLLAAPVMIDLRNIYGPEEMTRRGYRYTGVGR
jgi:UDPglucose 6-dehydrogenase